MVAIETVLEIKGHLEELIFRLDYKIVELN